MFHIAALVATAICMGGPGSTDDWTTFYERSGHTRTPDYETTVAYCRRLADASPWVHYTTFGRTPQGRDMVLLVVSRDGLVTPDDVRATDRAVVLVQAGIHAGEIDGKDAGLMLVRDMAITRERENLLDNCVVLFIPVFNVDGHENSGKYKRANQNGPEEMGYRATATRLNLNRDFMKADAPEMWAWHAMFQRWLPDFVVDCHVTDGADYQYPLTYIVETFGGMDEELVTWAKDSYLDPLLARLDRAGYPAIEYQWYRKWHDPASGIVTWTVSPRFCTGYSALQNRPALLIETHALKDYKTRVSATYEMLVHTLDIVGRENRALHRLVHRADARAASRAFRDHPFPLTYERTTDSTMIEFRGYEYEWIRSDITGGYYPRFSSTPVTRMVPIFDRHRPVATRTLPEAYVIPPEWQDVIARIEAHGVAVARTRAPVSVEVNSYRFEDPSWEEQPYEGRHRVSYGVVPFRETRRFPYGSAVIDMNQRTARVIAHLLEPEGPDSYLSWGFFDTIFERKEYVEAYLLEPIAAEMLEEDPEMARELEARKQADPEFASDPQAILMWLYRRTPYWNDRINVYPVARIEERDDVDALLEALPEDATHGAR